VDDVSFLLQLVLRGVLAFYLHRISGMDTSMGAKMTEWILNTKRLPEKLDAYDVTLIDPYGGRLMNVALFRPENSTWELMTDKHNYQDCKVIAWKHRGDPYHGKL
jgi:hypothetical protein